MTIDLINLPESVKSALLADCTAKLEKAQNKKPDLLKQLAQVDDEIKGYDTLIKALTTLNTEPSEPKPQLTTPESKVSKYDGKYDGGYKDGASYSGEWTHAQKIKYVADRPEKYGFKTLKGAGGVVDAILIEQPEWLDELTESATGKRGTLIGKIAPIISRMVDTGHLVKLRFKGVRNEFHYISADWFDQDGHIKAEHAGAVENLESISPEKKLAPVAAGASAESETDVGGNMSQPDASEKLNGHSLGQFSLSNSH